MKTTAPNKAILLTAFFLLISLFIKAQTTYTFTGPGNWLDTASWSPSYPGTKINTGDTVIINGDIDINTFISNAGTINALGPVGNSYGIRVDAQGILEVTNTGTINIGLRGYLTISNFGKVYVSNVGVINIFDTGYLRIGNSDGDLFNNGIITVSNYGTLFVSRNLYISETGTLDILSLGKLQLDGGFITNAGTITNMEDILNNGGKMYITNSGALNNSGYLQSFNKIIITGTGSLSNAGSIDIEGSSSIDNYGNLDNSGNLTINSGAINNYATLLGNNISHVGNFTNNGILNPGVSTSNTIGTYKFNNNYVHNGSILNIELESITSFDKINIATGASLNGILNVSLLNGYEPSVGDSFTIINASSVSGTFATTNFPAGYTFNVTYTGTTVTLEVTSTLRTIDREITIFKMYPNPVTDELTIQLEGATELENVTIYNLLGQEVLTSTERIINTSSLASGTYMVEVKTNIGKETEKLIIK